MWTVKMKLKAPKTRRIFSEAPQQGGYRLVVGLIGSDWCGKPPSSGCGRHSLEMTEQGWPRPLQITRCIAVSRQLRRSAGVDLPEAGPARTSARGVTGV